MRQVGICLLVIALAVTAAQIIVYGPRLPDRVASHFDVGGRADAWMSKWLYIGLFVAIQIGLAGFLIGIGRFTSRLPDSMINIPNKEYWLHEDRRAQTFRALDSMMIWLAALTALFIVTVFQLTIQANLAKPEARSLAMAPLISSLVVFLAAIGITICVFYRRFK